MNRTSGKDQGHLHLPKDAQIIALFLKSMGVELCEPGVIPQLLEFVYRYAVEIIQEAQALSEHAEKDGIDASDVQLAVQTKVNHSFIPPPPRQFLMDIASKRNSQPLPFVPERQGIRLPPERHCLLSLNYQIIPPSVKQEAAPSIMDFQTNVEAITSMVNLDEEDYDMETDEDNF